MKTVYKYEIPIQNRFELVMPEEAIILHIDTQFGKPCIWAEVQTEKDYEGRTFFLYGTGHEIDESIQLEFIGTIKISGGTFVYHVYEHNP